MEKLVKSVNSIKQYYGGEVDEANKKDAVPMPTKNERQECCKIMAESILSSPVKGNADYAGSLGVTIETLLLCCQDAEADVRIAAEESINRIIKGTDELHFGKVLVEFYKEIKRNGSSRSLRAALVRFANLTHRIRPSKCRPYVVSLLPAFIRICERNDDTIQECLASSVTKIFPLIGAFAAESELQKLIDALMRNLSNNSAAIRRTSATCIFEVINNSSKKQIMLSNVVSAILSLFKTEKFDSNFILGCLTALRYIIPLFATSSETMKRRTGSFGSDKDSSINIVFDDVIAQVFELCTYFFCHTDPNIVTASLETLQALLKLPSESLKRLLDEKALLKNEFSENLSAKINATPDKSKNTTSISTAETVNTINQLNNEEAATSNSIDEPSSEQKTVIPNLLSKNDLEITPKEEDTPHISESEVNNHSPRNNGEEHVDSVIKSLDDDVEQSSQESPEHINKCEHLYTGSPVEVVSRLLCERILQIGSNSTKDVRVSAKNLALSCLGSILKFYPKILFMSVLCDGSASYVTEILRFKSFYDPQIRSCTVLTISQYIVSAMIESKGNYEMWLTSVAPEDKQKGVSIAELVEVISGGLQDESVVSTRKSIQAVKLCFDYFMKSRYVHLGMKLLSGTVALKNTSYWLVKVDMLDLFSQINFRQVLFAGSEITQEIDQLKMFSYIKKLYDEINDIGLSYLADRDVRVRNASASMLVKLVSNSGVVVDSYKCNMATSEAAVDCKSFNTAAGSPASIDPSKKGTVKNLLKTYRGYEMPDPTSLISQNLSELVGKLSSLLHSSTSKHLTLGCINALLKLSNAYSISKHRDSYNCNFFQPDLANAQSHSSKLQHTGIFPLLLSMLESAWVPLEITAHANVILLAGNYLAGIACHGFQAVGVNPKIGENEALLPVKGTTSTEIPTSLSSILDKSIGTMAVKLLGHILKLMSIFHHIIADAVPTVPNKSVLQTLQNTPSLPNTLKKKDKKDLKDTTQVPEQKQHKKTGSGTKPPNVATDEVEKEKSTPKALQNSPFSFAHSRLYMKVYDLLLGAFESYKTTVDVEETDRFSTFLQAVLDVFCQILEITTFDDIEKYTEEILSYLRTTFTIEPTLTVQSVQQLLKSLFGTNLVSQWDLEDQIKIKSPTSHSRDQQHYKASFYHQVFHHPLNDLTMAIANASFHHYLQQENTQKASSGWFGSIKKKVEKKLTLTAKRSKGDKMSIQNYIRLFESIVIKSLKNYTMTSSVEFQKHVLNLLAQLVQLRVNYCLLDSDQIFIGFIVKQFEAIESGLVRNSGNLIPHVFFFLVLLSYEKHHSKSVMTMPKIIQLCDGMMASGCDTVTHTIPALLPIVHDLFVLRAGMKQDSTSDLDTQREVTQSMLFRIIEQPEVLSMVTTILQYYRKENPEQWKKYSRQVTDVLLPLISHLKLSISKHSDIAYLHSLFEALSPTALRPIDLVLNIFFMMPSDLSTISYHQRWIMKTVSLLRVLLCHLKEEYLLLRVREMEINAEMFSCQIFKMLVSQESENGEARAAELTTRPAPEEVLSQSFLQIIGFTVDRMVTELFNPVNVYEREASLKLLSQLLSEFLLTVTYICRSGSFKRLTIATKKILSQDAEEHDKSYFSAEEMCDNFHCLSRHYPIMTVLWSQLLTCVGFTDLSMWGKLTGKSTREISTNVSIPSLNEGMVHQGSIIMLSDYICQNQSEVEVMSWLIVNHIEDIISLHTEPPIQDFISAIHRSSSASGLFIESIKSMLSSSKRHRISFKKRILFCLRGLHLNQSDALLSLLLCDDWFVFSSMFAVSEFSDRMACDRVEMMLTQGHDNGRKELLIAQLKSLQPQLEKCEPVPRFGRLTNLVKRLLFLLETGTDEYIQISQDSSSFSGKNPDKNWYKDLVFKFVENSVNANEIAAALNFLDYDDIIEVMKKNTFPFDCVEGCLSYALSEITRPDDAIARYTSDVTTPMLKATLEILKRNLQEFTAQFPTLKTDFVNNMEKLTFEIDYENYSDVSDYWKKIIVIFSDEGNRKMVVSLCRALSQCLLWQKAVKQPFQIFASLSENLLRLGVCCHEYLIWTLIKGDKIDIGEQLTCLEFIHQLLQNSEVQTIFYSDEKVFYSLTIANSLYALYGVLTGEIHPLPDDSNHFNKSKSPYSYLNEKSTSVFVIRKTCELMDKLSNIDTGSTIPGVITAPLKHSVQQVLCHPVFNDLARVPQSLFKADMKQREIVSLSKEPAGEYLQDKDMLKEFIGKINALGWINRMQFEETWTSLLGVLVSQPIGDASQNATPVDETAIQISCQTIDVLTALVVNTCMKPQGGQLATGAFQNIPRTTVAALPDNKIGHELRVIQCTIEQELANVVFGEETSQTLEYFQLISNTLHVIDTAIVPSEILKSRLTLDLERRELKPLYYGIGQRSVRSFRMLHDIAPVDEDTSEFSSDDENFVNVISSDDLNSETSEKETNAVEVDTPPRQPPRPRVEQQIVDAHSCVQFLIDLFSEWFRSSSMISPTQQSGSAPLHVLRLPRQFLCECLHSLILISDFFKERQQFEWMFNALNSLQLVQPSEDDIMLQYLVLGMCKAGAVLGINKKVSEILLGMIESALGSSLQSCQTFALYGALYILECELREYARPMISLLSKFVCEKFKNINTGVIIHSQQLLRNVISVGFYLIEKWQVYITPAHTKTFVQGSISLLSSSHSIDIPDDLYITLMQSLENLITSYSLSASDCDSISKLSIDQFGNSESSVQLLASLNLTVTCMYFRMMRVSEANSSEDEMHESKLLTMEKCGLMFDKIKTSNRKEAEVIVRVLPTLLDRFFSTQDMMNKVIGEFVSSFHPFPELIATILHRVFQILHSRGEGSIVTEWVMLSLGNFTQKAPSSAIWCLTCIFLSASTNHWINSLLPLVLSEMHQISSDYEKFFVSAMDFYTGHLSVELDQRTFHSIFKAVAKPGNPYQIMLDMIENLDTNSN